MKTLHHLFPPEGGDHLPFEAPPQDLTTEQDQVDDIEGLTGSIEYLAVPDDADTAAKFFGSVRTER